MDKVFIQGMMATMKSSSESSVYDQEPSARRKLQTERFTFALQLDRQFGSLLDEHWGLLDLAKNQLKSTVKSYQSQHKRTLDARLQVRRCRHGCAVCPHTRLAFFQGKTQVEFPLQTRALREHGIWELASVFRNQQQTILREEEHLSDIYRATHRFWNRSLDNLRAMDESLAEIGFPDYQTPFIAPDPFAAFYPLPHLSISLFSHWVDNAMISLSNSLLRYATEFAKTKYGRAKQGFYGIRLRKRKNLLQPLFPVWRLYFRGAKGIWFGTHKVIYKPKLYQGTDGQQHPVTLNPRFIARSGNKTYFQDIKQYRKYFTTWRKYATKQEQLNHAYLSILNRY